MSELLKKQKLDSPLANLDFIVQKHQMMTGGNQKRIMGRVPSVVSH
jgi:hypothetical protein